MYKFWFIPKHLKCWNKIIMTVMNLFYPFHVKFHSYSSRDFNSRDSRDYGPPPRDYSYRDYPSSGSRDDYGSMSRGYRYKSRVTWILNHDYFLVHNKWIVCHLVIVMATVEDGNPEAIWTVRADPIESHTMVMVRHDYIVQCTSKKSCIKNMEIHARSPTISSHKMLELFAQSRGNASGRPIKICLIREGFVDSCVRSELASPLGEKNSFKVTFFL